MSRETKTAPRTHFTLSMHPYLKIDKNKDGSGGGFTVRLYGASPDPILLDIEWGETTEIEITGVELKRDW